MNCMQSSSHESNYCLIQKFQYRKRYELHAICHGTHQRIWRRSVSIPQAIWIACNFCHLSLGFFKWVVSIPQAVWIACNAMEYIDQMSEEKRFNTASGMNCMQCQGLLYERGNELVSIPQAVWIACNVLVESGYTVKRTRFNTASGMDCMQYIESCKGATIFVVSIPQAVWIACNRWPELVQKKSGKVSIPQAVLIACNFEFDKDGRRLWSFNTASGMDCMQLWKMGRGFSRVEVSIPQAVWIACNQKVSDETGNEYEFQYRKRYELHAILMKRNPATGIETFQYRKRYELHAIISSWRR